MFEVDAIAAQGHVVHGTPGDQPHHQLDTFAACFAHIVDMRDGGGSGRVVNQFVQKGVVKFLVDESGARALQLVAHAAGPPDVHVQVFVVTFNRLADGLTELVAALTAGHRVLHHVDGKRNHRAGPFEIMPGRVAAHQR